MAYPHVITMSADGGESLARLKVPHSSVFEWWRRRGALVTSNPNHRYDDTPEWKPSRM